MTVPSQIPVTEYIANGVTVLFPFNFLCFSAADLEVMADLVPVDPVNYTVAGLNVPTGGSVNFLVPPANGVKITIRLSVILSRTTDYQTDGDLLAGVVNRDFDRLWLAQQGSAVDLDSAVKFPPGEQAGYLPAVDDRKGKALVFNPTTGDPEPSADDYVNQAANAAASAAAAQQSNLDAQSAAAAATSAASAAQNSASSAADSAQEAAEALTDIASFVTVVPSGNIASTNVQAALQELDAEKPQKTEAQWFGKAIGEPFFLQDDIVGISPPPTNSTEYRFIRLTASDSYNTGVLTSESVSGSSPEITATAVISLSGSPINGATVQLINTERRFLRAGGAGTLQNSDNKAHTHGGAGGASFIFGSNAGITAAASGSGGTTWGVAANTASSGGTEARSRNIGATAYMRIK
ncbi:hypothetical protein ELS24_10560 [Achromobacter spanius]|uniref:hypothetical protein n=1 Tax=Achromobacter spanius TaxID=217203 RepID=UPI000F8F85C9|nr:hypothetical protein [Achromobacter spanius]AZS78849.1 hypothetical protein ELS24_10560 [Achromobacter spanius]